jgi:hypothetical protein
VGVKSQDGFPLRTRARDTALLGTTHHPLHVHPRPAQFAEGSKILLRRHAAQGWAREGLCSVNSLGRPSPAVNDTQKQSSTRIQKSSSLPKKSNPIGKTAYIVYSVYRYSASAIRCHRLRDNFYLLFIL